MREYVRRLLAGRYVVQAVADGSGIGRRPVRAAGPGAHRRDDAGAGRFRLAARAASKTLRRRRFRSSCSRREPAKRPASRASSPEPTITLSSRSALANSRPASVGTSSSPARGGRPLPRTSGRRVVLESITDAFFALDSEWRFTYMNAEAERINGVSRGELLGKSHWDVFPASVGHDRRARIPPCRRRTGQRRIREL